MREYLPGGRAGVAYESERRLAYKTNPAGRCPRPLTLRDLCLSPRLRAPPILGEPYIERCVGGALTNNGQTARSAPIQKCSRKSRFSTLPEPFFGRSVSENSTWRGTL